MQVAVNSGILRKGFGFAHFDMTDGGSAGAEVLYIIRAMPLMSGQEALHEGSAVAALLCFGVGSNKHRLRALT